MMQKSRSRVDERFPGLRHAPAQVRVDLRNRFERKLRRNEYSSQVTEPRTSPDPQLLELLRQVTIKRFSETDKAQQYYESISSNVTEALTFDQTIEKGWFDVVWARLTATGLSQQHRIQRDPSPQMKLLRDLHHWTFKSQSDIPSELRGLPELTEYVEKLDGDEVSFSNIRPASAEWIASRLWEQRPKPDTSDPLRWWADRWELLDRPNLTPSHVWDNETTIEYINAVGELIASPDVFVTWPHYSNRLVRRLKLGRDFAATADVGTIPGTLVDRYLWLNRYNLEPLVMASLETLSVPLGLVKLALNQAAQNEFGQQSSDVAKTMFTHAIDRPELLANIGFYVHREPRLLADLLMLPRTAALACMLVAGWRQHWNHGFDRGIDEVTPVSDRSSAFADACWMLGHWLDKGQIEASEFAALMAWLHSNRHGQRDVDTPDHHGMLQTVREVLAEQDLSLRRGVSESLLDRNDSEGLGSPAFAAYIDILTLGDEPKGIASNEAASQYVESLRSGRTSFSLSRLTDHGAKALTQNVRNAGQDEWAAFLGAIDVRQQFERGMQKANSREFGVKLDIARSIRAHATVLSRAIVGLASTDAQDDLVAALGKVIRDGASDQIGKGQVAAFSLDSMSMLAGTPREPALSKDLAAALRALPESAAQSIVDKIVMVDEPILLADLIMSAPSHFVPQLEARLSELIPEDATPVWSLIDIRARIEAILNTGNVALAEQYIAFESKLASGARKPSDQALSEFRNNLRLGVLKQDWESVLNAEPPEGLREVDKDSALDALEFFKGIAHLRPNGNSKYAIGCFLRLSKKHPQVTSYAQNLFAAQITDLLKGDDFKILEGDDFEIGLKCLREADDRLSAEWLDGDEERALFNLNRSILMLALGDPERAYTTLFSVKSERQKPVVAGAISVALFRMGKRAEAMSALQEAINNLGEEPDLLAAQAHIESGLPITGAIGVQPDPAYIESTRSAYARLHAMDARDQAVVVSAKGDLNQFIVHQIRTACQAFTALGPRMLEYLCSAKEDDVSAWLCKLLSAQLGHLGWSVHFQGERGYSARGNVGKPDIFLEHQQNTVSIVEAVVFDDPVNRQTTLNDLASHAQRTFGYADCPSYVYLIYSYRSFEQELLTTQLQNIAEKHVPAGIEYRGLSEEPAIGELPSGFTARYLRNGRELALTFLIVDLDQSDQAGAARSAGETKKNKGELRPNPKSKVSKP